MRITTALFGDAMLVRRAGQTTGANSVRMSAGQVSHLTGRVAADAGVADLRRRRCRGSTVMFFVASGTRPQEWSAQVSVHI